MLGWDLVAQSLRHSRHQGPRHCELEPDRIIPLHTVRRHKHLVAPPKGVLLLCMDSTRDEFEDAAEKRKRLRVIILGIQQRNIRKEGFQRLVRDP